MSDTSPRPPAIAELPGRFLAALPTHFDRLRLSAGELERLQTQRLRSVLGAALDRSAFHRARLDGLDPWSFTLADLPALPTMTKADVMANFDDVVTDRRLRLDALELHLASAGPAPRLHLDEFVVMSTGGSSGLRGVFVADVAAAADQMAAVVRGGLAGVAAITGWPPPVPVPVTIVAAPTSVHATRCLSSLFLHGGVAEITYAPVTEPFEHIVDVVDAARPMLLIGYPSVVARLAARQSEGGMSIRPVSVVVTSEHLSHEQAEAIADGFGVAPTNSYGTTEGLMGSCPSGSDVFTFASDVAIVEFVDRDDRPVGRGVRADHVLVTNLANHVQPLIRYRIEDAMVEADPSTGDGHQRARLDGRDDEEMTIGDVTVHPLTIRSVLGRFAAVGDYRVVASASGIDVEVVATRARLDVDEVRRSLATALAHAGASNALVHVAAVDEIPRDPRTGKVRRFAPA